MKKIFIKTKSFILKCKRVWYVLRKPTRKEFETIAKVSAVGILILGFIGFLISLVMKIFLGQG
jgi:protein transport protein SEC61 subunit gamma and related proteins